MIRLRIESLNRLSVLDQNGILDAAQAELDEVPGRGIHADPRRAK